VINPPDDSLSGQRVTTPSPTPPPARGLRPGALLVSGVLGVGGSLAVLLGMSGSATDGRVAAAWALVQFISGVWAGVLGANSPFLHGLVAGLPALVLGLTLPSPLPAQYVVVAWFLAPSAALLAGMALRYRRRR
jgi:hypothetical protein